jgi:UDP-3-O-acyl N-acetylglucosamine deacetylase
MYLIEDSRRQTTLKGPVSVTGRGYWLGRVNTLTFLPAAADTGIRFYRRDLFDDVGTLAVSEHCQGLSMRTCLGEGHRRFEMIEHVMAALAGMQVDNAHVWCTHPEMPGMDGSSFAFTTAIHEVGTVELPAPRRAVRITDTIRVGTDDQWLRVEPAECTCVEYQLDYGDHSPLGRATFASIVQPLQFHQQISPARTFVTRDEARALQARGLAIHATERDLLVFDHSGPVGNTLRFPDECARHKALDVIGDLAVVGCDVIGKFVGYRSGHQLNAQLARKLREIVLNVTGETSRIPGAARAA